MKPILNQLQVDLSRLRGLLWQRDMPFASVDAALACIARCKRAEGLSLVGRWS